MAQDFRTVATGEFGAVIGFISAHPKTAVILTAIIFFVLGHLV